MSILVLSGILQDHPTTLRSFLVDLIYGGGIIFLYEGLKIVNG